MQKRPGGEPQQEGEQPAQDIGSGGVVQAGQQQ